MRAVVSEPKYLERFIWDQGNLQVSNNRSNPYLSINNEKGRVAEKLFQKEKKSLRILSSVLNSLNFYQLFQITDSSSPLIHSLDIMDPEQQQRLLMQFLQQQKLDELKQVSQQQHQHHNLVTDATHLWFSLFATQQNGIFPSISLLNTASTASNGCQQSFGFGLIPGIFDVSFVPGAVPISAPLLNTASVNGAQNVGLLLASEREKEANFAEQTLQNFTKDQANVQIPKLTVPHLSTLPTLKRRVSESAQQQQPEEVVEGTKVMPFKRAKVTVINQKEPAPCFSANCSSSLVMKADKTEKYRRNKNREQGRGNNESDEVSDVSNYKDNDEKGDDEDVQYVDVETVDEKLDSKQQRKALIEFYRKVKSLRLSYSRDCLLMCQMCEQQVQNSDSLILTHLYKHAKVMPYRCKMCGAGECQLERMYAHIRQGHPDKNPSTTYENRRNMSQLICLLKTCFPRNITKTKAAYSDVVDKICEVVKEKSLEKLTCMVCTRKISTRKLSITRHAQTHLHYRCKNCGITVFGDTTIVAHSTEKHGIVDPQCKTHYDACINNSEKTETALRNCFSNILDEKS